MRSLALLSVLALTLAACGGGGGGPETGTLRLLVTDDPFPFSAGLVASATVQIVRVEARNADLEGWQVLFDATNDLDEDGEEDGAREVDLVPLSGGISALLVEIQVPVGTYDEVRLIVDAGTVVLTEEAITEQVLADGSLVHPEGYTFSVENGLLRFPSGAQSGIKVKIENDIVVTTQLAAGLTLHFDLATNFVFNGSPERAPGVKRVNFTPVVRATNTSTDGGIRLEVLSDDAPDGTVDVPLPYPTVEVYAVPDDGSTPPFATFVGDDLGLVQGALPLGTYDLHVMARGHGTVTVEGVVVDTVANAPLLAPVTLPVAAFWLDGHVFSDPGGGAATEPLPGADVILLQGGAEVTRTTTDDGGTWFLTDQAPGTYTVRFEATGHDPEEVAGVEVVDYVMSTVPDVTLVATP